MKTLGLVLLLCVGAQEARAQGSGFAGYGSGGALLLLGGFAVTGGLMIGGTVTGIGSSISVAERTASKNWFGASYAFGALNTIAGAIWIPVAIGSAGGRGIDPGWAAMATAHLAIGLWNLITPTIGLLRGAEVRTVAPVFISGRAVGGRRWSGLGVQLATF